MENNRLKRVEWVDLSLPSLQDFDRYLGWMIGRVAFSGWLFAINTVRLGAKIVVAVMDQTERATHKLLEVYAQMPHRGTLGATVIDATAVAATPNVPEIITDIVGAIEGKQLMIIGPTGTGKSVLAQYLAYTVGGKVRVMECEGTPDDWTGLEVIGKGEDWEAINQALGDEMTELTERVQIRREGGDKELMGREEVTIVEEYPEVRQKCDNADEWFERHARRGRKMQRFIICISQFDKVAAWGLEGKSDLGDCFYRLRLGKSAVNQAKHIGNDELEAWLKQDRSHCLLDDSPCKLPSYREMKAVTQRFSITSKNSLEAIAKMPENKGFQTFVTENYQDEKIVSKAVKVCLDAGLSDTKIIKELLGYEGGQFKKGKQLLETIKEELSKS